MTPDATSPVKADEMRGHGDYSPDHCDRLPRKSLFIAGLRFRIMSTLEANTTEALT